jgi:hypothetical protein
MDILDRAEGFEWDGGNRRKSADKHAVSPEEAEQVFSNEPLLLLDDRMHSGHEPRFHAYGQTNSGRLLQISFTLRDGGRTIRVILSRPMSRRERERYADES